MYKGIGYEINGERMAEIAKSAAEQGECSFSIEDLQKILWAHDMDVRPEFLASAPVASVAEWALQSAFVG